MYDIHAQMDLLETAYPEIAFEMPDPRSSLREAVEASTEANGRHIATLIVARAFFVQSIFGNDYGKSSRCCSDWLQQ